MKRILLPLIVAFIATAGWMGLASWKRLPEYTLTEPIELAVPLMTPAEYGEVIETHPRPYVVEVSSGAGAALIYGAEHTKNPEDPQIADITERWGEFKPTVALCESRLGILFPGLMNPVQTFSEPGAVHALARRAGIPTYTWEPSIEGRMEYLLALPYSKEQVALRVILGPYFSNRRHGKPDNPEGMVAEAVKKRGNWPGIEGVFADVAAVDAAWQKYFPDGPDWREVSDQYGLPGFLAELDDNPARDEHFVRVVIDLVQRGERVFAVAGLSHAVKLEPALRGAFPTQVP